MMKTYTSLLQSIRLDGRRLYAAVLNHKRPGAPCGSCEGGSYLIHQLLEE